MKTKQQNSKNVEILFFIIFQNTNTDVKLTDPIRVARHGVASGTLFINFITNYFYMKTK